MLRCEVGRYSKVTVSQINEPYAVAQKRINFHNFFDVVYALSALWWYGLAQDRQTHKKTKQMSRARDGGTVHAKGDRMGTPLNAMVRPFLPSTRAFSLPGVCAHSL